MRESNMGIVDITKYENHEDRYDETHIERTQVH